MNKLYLILCLIFTCICLQAQPPQGGGRGMGGGNRQGPPQGMGQRSEAGSGEQLVLDSFPAIPAITLEQRAEIGNILAKEQKDVFKLIQKKHELMEKEKQSTEEISEKDKAKMQKNLAKIDAKIQKRMDKSNKKIRKILSDEQYQVFLEKRGDFKFRRQMPAGVRPQGEGGFRERPEGGGNRGMRR